MVGGAFACFRVDFLGFHATPILVCYQATGRLGAYSCYSIHCGVFRLVCRSKLLAEPFSRAWSGMVLVLLGLAFYVFCALSDSFHHHNLMGLGVASTLIGIALLIFGWRAMRYLWFPLLYLFVFGQTISDRFMEVATFKLQDIASYGSYIGFSILGFDVVREGNTLEIFYKNESYPLNIAEACSGMRMLMAFFALGVAMAYTGLTHIWQQIVLVLFALPTAIFVNILRVMTLGLLSIIDSGFAAGDFHTFVGTLWLIPAFLIYLGIVWVLKNLLINDEPEEVLEEAPSKFMFIGRPNTGFFDCSSALSHYCNCIPVWNACTQCDT